MTAPGRVDVADVQWTAERANRALPLVRRIAEDLVRAYRRWQELVERFELASLKSTAARQDPDAQRLSREIQETAREVQGFVAELASLGVECKGLEDGLVDFPGERDGVPIYYCWKVGERAVEHWHPRDAGFAGRQPLP